MRQRSDVYLILALAAFALAGVTAMQIQNVRNVTIEPPILVPPQPVAVDPAPPQASGDWFSNFRQYCNPVDVETRMRWQPAPESVDGQMHKAACYALAGKIDRARDVIQELPSDRRAHAANVVFNIGHPAADAGDEIAAGPLMELVVEFVPNHYMALYHAGAASYERGDWDLAPGYLKRFLQEYSVEDGWRRNAIAMLAEMGHES